MRARIPHRIDPERAGAAAHAVHFAPQRRHQLACTRVLGKARHELLERGENDAARTAEAEPRARV